jgi:hypothetical protein
VQPPRRGGAQIAHRATGGDGGSSMNMIIEIDWEFNRGSAISPRQ